MDNKDRQTIQKIRKHASDIVVETASIQSAEQFHSENSSKAALFDLLQIGELVGLLSTEVIHQCASIPWAQMHGLRNRIVHGYASVDYQIIWETIQSDIPALILELDQLLANESSNNPARNAGR